MYNKQAAKWVTKPQQIFVMGETLNTPSKTKGLYKKEITNPIQNELHSGQSNGLLTKGIRATKFLTGAKISAKLHI